jgi:hypothetical protein
MIKLFADNDISRSFAGRSNTIIDTINQFCDEKILGCDIDEWVNYYFEVYKYQPITLYMENITQSLSEKLVNHNPNSDYYDSAHKGFEGYKITFTIPFDGSTSLLYTTPSSRILSSFPVDYIRESKENAYGEIIFSLEYTKHELQGKTDKKVFISSQFNQQFKSYVQIINNINKDITNYNCSLPNIIRNALEKRKKRQRISNL